MKKIFIISVILTLCIGGVLPAEDKPDLYDEEEVLSFCDTVMGHLEVYNYDTAFDLLYNIAVRQMKQGIVNLKVDTKRQIDQITPDFGKIIGYKLLDFENKEDVLLEVRYLLLFEYHALRWEFLFYKPKEEWYLDNVFWNDTLTELFQK